MPELIEVEQYRRALDALVGSTLGDIEITHDGYVRPRGVPVEVFDGLVGATLRGTRRKGKLLLVDLGAARNAHPSLGFATIGLRFGMTGMLLIDGGGPIERLEYASTKNDQSWDRLRMHFGESVVSIRDQRRLGSIELDPDEDQLGPDAATVTADELRWVMAGTRRAVKTVLLDQSRLAGVGNLLADEVLWRTGLRPDRCAGELTDPRVADLAAEIRRTISVLSERGGSHTGDSFAHRAPGATCPRCEGSMRHSTVGGRSTWWCSDHQR